jgi:hypothetical protein
LLNEVLRELPGETAVRLDSARHVLASKSLIHVAMQLLDGQVDRAVHSAQTHVRDRGGQAPTPLARSQVTFGIIYPYSKGNAARMTTFRSSPVMDFGTNTAHAKATRAVVTRF